MQRRFWAATILAALVLSLSCGPKLNPNEIRIGEYGSLTGAQATFGVSTQNGIQLAVDEVNAAGGVNGKTLKVIALDDEGKPEEAAVVVTKLITEEKAQVILGEVASSLSLAAAPICQEHKTPMISPSSTNPKVTQVGDYVFRVCFIDPFQGQVMADFAMGNLKAKTA
ncbi:MAG TPA: ABC transporter substrate-binding protein, partial [bacterium]|nr:ABC transporter substrate-binding protein [bacterium]